MRVAELSVGVLVGAGLTLGLGGQSPRGDSPARSEVSIRRDESLRANVYTVVDEDCRVEWTVYLREPNRGVVRHWSDCPGPLDTKARLMELLLGKVMESEGPGWEFRTLSWGRVYGDGERDATMAVRLAVAARKSPAWDMAAGKPRQGDINGLVRHIFREAGITDELKRAFMTAGLRLEASAVEKVLVQRAGATPIRGSLSNHGVPAGDRVPYDCQLWFSVQPGTPSK